MIKEITERQFGIYKFTDDKGNKCSLQKSSVATRDCIWLGLHDPDIQEFWPSPRDANQEAFVNLTKDDLQKLRSRPQNDIYAFSRMHLTQDQVKELLPILQHFAETGDI